jgi:hypothetical protein
MPYCWRTIYLAIIAIVCLASTSRADSAVMTSDVISMFWDGSLSGIYPQRDGTHLIAEGMNVPPQSFQAGQVADLSRPVGTNVNLVTVTVGGTTYSSVRITTIVAK